MTSNNSIPILPNSAWTNIQDMNDEDALEMEEAQVDEELKQIFSQDIGNQSIVGMCMKEDEEEDEEEEIDEPEEDTEEAQMEQG